MYYVAWFHYLHENTAPPASLPSTGVQGLVSCRLKMFPCLVFESGEEPDGVLRNNLNVHSVLLVL